MNSTGNLLCIVLQLKAQTRTHALTSPADVLMCICRVVRRLLFQYRVRARRRAKRHAHHRRHQHHHHTSSVGEAQPLAPGAADAAGAADSTTGLVEQEAAARTAPGGKMYTCGQCANCCSHCRCSSTASIPNSCIVKFCSRAKLGV